MKRKGDTDESAHGLCVQLFFLFFNNLTLRLTASPSSHLLLHLLLLDLRHLFQGLDDLLHLHEMGELGIESHELGKVGIVLVGLADTCCFHACVEVLRVDDVHWVTLPVALELEHLAVDRGAIELTWVHITLEEEAG